MLSANPKKNCAQCTLPSGLDCQGAELARREKTSAATNSRQICVECLPEKSKKGLMSTAFARRNPQEIAG